MNIGDIQKEILILLDKIDLLYEIVNLAIKRFNTSNEIISDFIPFNKKIDDYMRKIDISLDDYQNVLIQGKSIEEIEKELVLLTTRVKFLCDYLREACSHIGHDYRFMEMKETFDFDSLEPCFEKKPIYCCNICGETIVLEKNGVLNEEEAKFLKKLRKARTMDIYESKFKILDILDKNFPIIR